MKLFIKSLCIAFVISVIYSVIPFQAECSNISDEVFRLHILANSDSEKDQNLKLKVRDEVLKYTKATLDTISSKQQAEDILRANLNTINDIAKKVVQDNGYNYNVKTEITNMHFSTRYYDAYTMPSGMYDSLRITIGSGKGHNWWCVMYPSICISTASEGQEKAKQALNEDEYNIVTSKNCEYKFFIVELFENLCNCFR